MSLQREVPKCWDIRHLVDFSRIEEKSGVHSLLSLVLLPEICFGVLKLARVPASPDHPGPLAVESITEIHRLPNAGRGTTPSTRRCH